MKFFEKETNSNHVQNSIQIKSNRICQQENDSNQMHILIRIKLLGFIYIQFDQDKKCSVHFE